MTSNIQSLLGREILDSRGNPTLEVDITLSSGAMGRASVPSGASTGRYEAVEYRDQDLTRYHGKGVLKAIEHLDRVIAPVLLHKPLLEQAAFDAQLCALEGTPNKARLGANTLLAVSMAAARARATEAQQPLFLSLADDSDQLMLPIPLMNIINGGAHANNNLDIQEFMIAPIGAQTFPQALQMGAEIFHTLKHLLKNKQLQTAVGDEGGFAPSLRSHSEALDLIGEAVLKAGFRLGTDIVFALDIAASELYTNTGYHLASEHKTFSSEELIQYYQSLVAQYPIKSIEDGLDQEDWAGWQALTRALGQHIQLIGDDIFVTHTHLLQRGIEQHIANAILIKPNQVGTLTETKQAIKLAQANGYIPVMSHRSGETSDAFIADLAVATRCPQIKTGSLCRMDRVEKYNQLLRIYETSHFPYATLYPSMKLTT